MNYNKFCFIDFEFSHINERDLSLVSCSLLFRKQGQEVADRTLWLYQDDQAKEKLRSYVKDAISKDYIFVSYVAEAEMRSLLTLFKDDSAAYRDWETDRKSVV